MLNLEEADTTQGKSRIRTRADAAKQTRCRTLICVLENPSNVGNVGSVIRNIDALGVGKLYVINPPHAKIQLQDWPACRTSRSTTACTSVSANKWVYMRTFKSTQDCIDHLAKRKYVSIVTSPHIKGKTNVKLTEGVYTQARLAVWFGNETTGISDEAIAAASTCVQIPMCGIVESLNLATCTGIVLHEIIKQRRVFRK